MYGVSAKERLAQLQQKGAKSTEAGKTFGGFGGLKPTPGKLNTGPGLLKKTEPPKAPVDPKKPLASQPAKPQEPVKPKAEEKKPVAAPEAAKPKEEPKTTAAPEPAKPKEEPKPTEDVPVKPKEEPKPAVPEPVKPKEEPKPAAVPEIAKPKEEPKAAAAPEPVKPKEEPKPAAPEPVKPKEEPKPAAPEPVKPKEEPKPAAVPQPAKPKEEPKPAAPQPAKPKEEPKPAAAPQPAKPKEEPKPAAPQPAKPKEEPKPATAPQPAKPKEEPKPAAPESVKPKEEPKPAVAPQPTKPKEEPKPATPQPAKPKEETKPAAATPEPVKPKEDAKVPEPAKPVETAKEASEKPAAKPTAAPPSAELKKPSEDFFRGIFYFSGMGALVGSALAEGVYVPEKSQRNAIDSGEIEAALERQRLRRGEEIIATARNQAQGLSTDFRHLQALLESLPTFTEVLEPQPLDRRAVDQVIHGHVYFQQEQHPGPYQTRATHQTVEQPVAPPVDREVSFHQPQLTKPPVGGVSVFPAAPPPKEPPPTFAAAIDEFDRVGPPTHQQPVFAAPPEPPQPRESPRLHRRERPTVEQPANVPLVPPGGARPYGVHTGQADIQASAWQDRYGQAEVTKFQAPRPFSATGGEIDSKGVKSWQLSHLRTLEAKGYQIVSDSEKDTIKSYSPYLVSDRSQGADRQRATHPYSEPSVRPPPFKPSPVTFSDDSSSLPYSDL